MNENCNTRLENYQKRILGIAMIAISPLSVLLGLPASQYNHPGWWHSVSQTFFASDNFVMIGLLSIIAIFSITYKTKSILERLVFIFLGISAIGILCFPHVEDLFEYAGIFHLKNSTCNSLHVLFAVLFFSDFVIISVGLLGRQESNRRKNFFVINGLIIFIADVCLAVRQALGVQEFMVIIFEVFAFTPFGINLLIKGNCFNSAND